MTDEHHSSLPSDANQLTAVERAVRARALDHIRQEQERPKRTLRDRLPALALTAGAVLVVVLLISFVVNGLMRIMDIWYPGAISGHVPAAVQPVPKNGNGIDSPYMIGVVEESSTSSSSAASSK